MVFVVISEVFLAYRHACACMCPELCDLTLDTNCGEPLLYYLFLSTTLVEIFLQILPESDQIPLCLSRIDPGAPV